LTKPLSRVVTQSHYEAKGLGIPSLRRFVVFWDPQNNVEWYVPYAWLVASPTCDIRTDMLVPETPETNRERTLDTMPPAVQTVLGDSGSDAEREARLTALVEQVGSITKAGQALHFCEEIVYAKVGGQQLKAKCVFCRLSLTSTGSTRVVDHMIVCIRAPSQVQKRLLFFACAHA
jgi:hypothetical protein